MDAARDRDRAALDRILAREFRLTSTRTDQWVARDQWLEMAMTMVDLRSFTIEASEAAVVGAAAVVWSRATQVAQVNGEDWSQRFMLTDVWVHRDERWQVLARHSSQPPASAFADPAR